MKEFEHVLAAPPYAASPGDPQREVNKDACDMCDTAFARCILRMSSCGESKLRVLSAGGEALADVPAIDFERAAVPASQT